MTTRWLFLGMMAPAVLLAQAAPLQPGSPVRVWTRCSGPAGPDRGCQQVEGTLDRASPDSLVMIRQERRFALSVAAIDSIQSRVTDGSQAGRGALFGVLIGTAVVTAFAAAISNGCESTGEGSNVTPLDCIGFGLIYGGLPGLLVGAVTGALIPRHRWQLVEVGKTSVAFQVGPIPSGAGVGISIRF